MDVQTSDPDIGWRAARHRPLLVPCAARPHPCRTRSGALPGNGERSSTLCMPDDPFAKPFNESEVKRTLQDMDAAEQEARMTQEENWERAKHVVPRNFLTEKFWYKKLRACCLCGLLKTQEMWLEVRLAARGFCEGFSCDGCHLSFSFERAKLSATSRARPVPSLGQYLWGAIPSASPRTRRQANDAAALRRACDTRVRVRLTTVARAVRVRELPVSNTAGHGDQGPCRSRHNRLAPPLLPLRLTTHTHFELLPC